MEKRDPGLARFLFGAFFVLIVIGSIVGKKTPDQPAAKPGEATTPATPTAQDAERRNPAQTFQQKEQSSKDDGKLGQGVACMYAQKLITAALKAPSTADFPGCIWNANEYWYQETVNTAVLTGYVDAQNSFGAKLRNHYAVYFVKRVPGGWSVCDIKMPAYAGDERLPAHCRVAGMSTNTTGAITKEQQQRDPPDDFRGIKWGSALPTVRNLRETVMKGCTAIVEQKNVTDAPACSHLHVDTDDMELFTQRQNIPLIFNVPVSEQLLMWSERKFWSGEVFIHNYKDADLAKLRAALIARYGQPTFSNENLHITKWSWPDKKIEISLSFDPVAKPSIGSSEPPQTSISLSFGKID
jgi:hypothetical protein